MIDSHSRKNDETVSVGNIVGGLVKPRGIVENQNEDADDETPLDVSNAAVSSIHQAVADNLSSPEQDDNFEYYNYTIKSGDTLGRIALDSGVDMAEIVRLNDIADPNRIRAGASLRIPTTDVQMFETVTGTKFPQAEAQDITITSPSSKGFVAPIDLGTDESAIARKLKIYAEKYDLPLDFVTAICASESSFSNVIGDKELENSAYGPMQVRLPALQDVQRYYGLDYTEEDLKNLDLNASIETGVAYLAMLRDNYGARNLNEIAAMYNGGPSAIKNKNENALGYASKVLDFRDRAMKEYNSMIKVAELGPHVSDGDEMFGVVSGGVTKPETEDRDELLDTTEYAIKPIMKYDIDDATDPTSFSTIKPIMKYDIDDQTADAFLDRDAYLDKSRPVAIRGTPRLDQANMPMVNYLIDTNELLANTDITDSDKISRMKASIAELTSDPVNFSPDQKRGPDFRDLFASPAFAPTLEEEPVLKPNQLGEPTTDTETSPFVDADTDGPAPSGLLTRRSSGLKSNLNNLWNSTKDLMKTTAARINIPEVVAGFRTSPFNLGEEATVEDIAAIAYSQNPLDAAYAYIGLDEDTAEGAVAVKGFFENIVPSWERLEKPAEEFATTTSWCAAFLTQVLRDSGVNTEELLGAKGNRFYQVRTEHYLKAGQGVDFQNVQAGDIMVKRHTKQQKLDDTTLGFGHVGVVVKVEGDQVYFLGGNSKDQVELSSYSNNTADLTFRRINEVSDIPIETVPSMFRLKLGKKFRQTKRKIGQKIEDVKEDPFGEFQKLLNKLRKD